MDTRMKMKLLILAAAISSSCGDLPTSPQRSCYTYKGDTTVVMPDGSQVTSGGTLVQVGCHGFPKR